MPDVTEEGSAWFLKRIRMFPLALEERHKRSAATMPSIRLRISS